LDYNPKLLFNLYRISNKGVLPDVTMAQLTSLFDMNIIILQEICNPLSPVSSSSSPSPLSYNLYTKDILHPILKPKIFSVLDSRRNNVNGGYYPTLVDTYTITVPVFDIFAENVGDNVNYYYYYYYYYYTCNLGLATTQIHT